MNEQKRHNRLDWIDCIRGLAALSVAYFHSALELLPVAHGWDAKVLRLFSSVLDSGKIGVIAFFMVSGFVIPMSFKANSSKPIGIRNFLISRIFRLYPAYWLSILGICILHASSAQPNFTTGRILVNLTMFQGFFGVHDMIGAYWTLQIEWIFYILCMFLFVTDWLSSPRRLLSTYFVFLVVAVLLAAARLLTHRALPEAVPLAMCVMFAAALWRMVRIENRETVLPKVRIAIATFLCTVPFISVLAYSFNIGHDEVWWRYTLAYWAGVGLFLLLTLKLTTKPSRLSQSLALIGRASYSLYLFQDIFGAMFEWIAPPERFSLLPVNAYILVKLIFDCACALLVYVAVEKPCIALGRAAIRQINVWENTRRVLTGSEAAEVAL